MPITMTIKEAQPKTGKRFTAIFRLHRGGKVIKITHFGQRGATTYIDGADKEKRKNFRARHKGDLKTKDFKRAGFLSMGLLWGEHTSLQKNIADYKKRFGLD
tara:strand:- start:732 stop:1037 length:306 start_codon:yes stop_codon:yes gene_type:complete